MEEYLKPLLTIGGFNGALVIIGIFYLGKRISRFEDALNRLTKGELLRLIASPHVTAEVKTEAAAQLKDVTDAIESAAKLK